MRALVVVLLLAAVSGSLSAQPAAPASRGDPALPKWVTARYGSLHYRVTERITSTASTADGRYLAVTSGNYVWVYDAATWELKETYTADDGEGSWSEGRLLSFSPDGRYLGYAHGSKTMFVLDRRTGRVAHEFGDSGRLRWGSTCVFTPDGLFGVADQKRAYYFDPVSGREVRSAPTGTPCQLSPAGDSLVRMNGAPGTVGLILCDARTGAELCRLNESVLWGNGRVGFAYSPDGKTVAALGGNDTLTLWDISTRTRSADLKLPAAPHPARAGEGEVGFTADGRTLFVRLKNGDLARWDVLTRRELARLRTGSWPPLGGLHNLPDGKRVLTPSYYDGVVRVWDGDTGAEVIVPGRYGYKLTLAAAPDGKAVAVGDEDGRLDLLDASTGRPIRAVRTAGPPIRQFAFSPDSRLVGVVEAALSERGADRLSKLRVLRAADGGEVLALGPSGAIRLLGFAADGRVLLFVQDRVRVVDLGTGQDARTFALPESEAGVPARILSLSPDGRRIAVCEPDAVSAWDTATDREGWRTPARKRDVNTKWAFDSGYVAWSADGKTLICARPTDLVTVHDAATGRETRRFKSNPAGIPAHAAYLTQQARLLTRAVALSPDGKRAATVGFGGTSVLIWDVANGGVIAELKHPFGVGAVVFTPDGKGLIATGAVGSGVAYRWDVEAAVAGYEG